MKQQQFLLGLMLLVFAQILVGVGIVGSKLLVSSAPVIFVLGVRFAIACLVLLVLHYLSAARTQPLSHYFSKLTLKDCLIVVTQGLFAGFLFNCLMFMGLSKTDANIAGIITSSLPAIIAVMSWLILKEKISAKKYLCVLLAVTGLAIIAVDKFKGFHSSHSLLGDLLVFLSLIPEAGYYILCKLYPNKLPVFLASSILNGVNAVLLLPAIFFLSWNPSTLSLQNWLIITLLGVSSGLFYVLWFIGSQKVDGIMASLSTSVMPVATVLISWLVLGEHLSMIEASGMGLVLLSIVVYAKR